jgi:small subunit ribosomal protein S20
MANTKSAKKATRKIAHRTEINKARRSRMRSSLRVVEDAISSGDKTAARAALVAAEPALMRAARNGIMSFGLAPGVGRSHRDLRVVLLRDQPGRGEYAR